MARRYRVELRRKVLDLIEAGRPVVSIAAQRGVSDQTIYHSRSHRVAVLRLGDDGKTPIGLVVLSILALGLLSVSGWLGGKLAYRSGVRAAEEQTQAEGHTSVSR